MTKEGIGTKGPTLSTYISIPGRYLVLMPALGRVGVSRKIEDEDVRLRLRDMRVDAARRGQRAADPSTGCAWFDSVVRQE